MVDERHRHRSAGSPRKSSFTAGLKRNNSSGSIFSRVLGSFRHKNNGDKGKKTSAQDKEERQDWMANYKGTHHPDRPLVDKRTQEVVSDEEYAARLGWVREKSHIRYDLSDPGGPPQAPVPNFSYSSMSPRSHRTSFVFPTFTKTGQPSRDRAPSREISPTNPGVASPILPGVGTIRIYNASALDRGPIIRYSEGSGRLRSPPPRKMSDGRQPSGRRGSRASMLGEKRTMAGIDITDPPKREPKTSAYNGSSASKHTPGLILNSSPTLPSGPQTCPWRGCHAVLGTAQEKKDNLCTICHEAIYPRESAFFDPPPPPRAVPDTHLETLHALTGSPTTADAGHTQARTIRRRPAGLDKRSSVEGFKLQPAPRGKRRHIAEARRSSAGDDSDSDSDTGSEKESGNETGRSVWSAFSSSDHEQQTSPGTQDADSFSPLHEGIFGSSPRIRSWGIRFSEGVKNDGSDHMDENGNKGEEGEEEEDEELISPHTKAPSDKSWTTDDYSTSSSSNNNSNEDLMFPFSDPDMETTRELYPPPLLQNGERAAAHQPRRPSQLYHRPRDTLLYRDIEDIIDCYADPEETTTGTAEHRHESRKADAVGSYFVAGGSEAEEMRRRGFI
ncbi:hypothetical protein F5Y00DRAFT_195171 [Daldinia vernicosa]|uniref:uncharacterized protein n=1 Tax=Daldinia vernicosa TaxID=114800 RepID=UPI0020086163|nr:uncharacterized protein F5Y00DRAFT_195171 [Daldinia vernicosa]KAI0852408.1 hypothetical protein F5Y00DRAFT_195171 [Daldinia vernicosa]